MKIPWSDSLFHWQEQTAQTLQLLDGQACQGQEDIDKYHYGLNKEWLLDSLDMLANVYTRLPGDTSFTGIVLRTITEVEAITITPLRHIRLGQLQVHN